MRTVRSLFIYVYVWGTCPLSLAPLRPCMQTLRIVWNAYVDSVKRHAYGVLGTSRLSDFILASSQRFFSTWSAASVRQFSLTQFCWLLVSFITQLFEKKSRPPHARTLLPIPARLRVHFYWFRSRILFILFFYIYIFLIVLDQQFE